MVITGKTITAEYEAADDGLEQIVGKAHATEDAEKGWSTRRTPLKAYQAETIAETIISRMMRL